VEEEEEEGRRIDWTLCVGEERKGGSRSASFSFFLISHSSLSRRESMEYTPSPPPNLTTSSHSMQEPIHHGEEEQDDASSCESSSCCRSPRSEPDGVVESSVEVSADEEGERASGTKVGRGRTVCRKREEEGEERERREVALFHHS